jgi:Zn-dependent peptidase ImmA (M78 family)
MNQIDPVIEERALQTLQKCGVTDAPVNPIAVAITLGYQVNAAAFPVPTTAGRTVVRNGIVSIDVNANSPTPQYRNFTIAHEIGHAVLHLNDTENAEIADLYLQIDQPKTLKELEADKFAMALLMPEEFIRRRYAVTKDPSALARQFGVTADMMTSRLTALQLGA